MKKLKIILFFCLMYSCSSNKLDVYYSTCELYGDSDFVLKLNSNKSFIYIFKYNERKITGTWSINSDTLKLESDIFLEQIDSLTAIIKVSDNYGFDKFLKKSNKLYVINKNGVQKNCFLKRK